MALLRAVPTPHKDAPPARAALRPDRVGARPPIRGHPLRARRGDRAGSRSTAPRSATRSGRRRWPSCATPSRRARDDTGVGAIIFTGAGDDAFCSGGDQRIRGDDGYIGDDEVAQQGVGRLDVGDLHVQIRRLPKPVLARSPATRSAAARSCTSSATSRSPPTTPSSARPGRGSAASTAASAPACSPAPSASARRRRSGSSAGSTRPRRRSRWGSSTRSCRSPTSSAEAVAWCREMTSALPALAAPAEGELQRRRGRAHRPAAALPRRDAALLHDRGGPGGPRRLQGAPPRPTSRSSRSGLDAVRASGSWRRGRGRCRRRSRRCWSAPAAAGPSGDRRTTSAGAPSSRR